MLYIFFISNFPINNKSRYFPQPWVYCGVYCPPSELEQRRNCSCEVVQPPHSPHASHLSPLSSPSYFTETNTFNTPQSSPLHNIYILCRNVLDYYEYHVNGQSHLVFRKCRLKSFNRFNQCKFCTTLCLCVRLNSNKALIQIRNRSQKWF